MTVNIANKAFSLATQNLLDLETTRMGAKARLEILTRPITQIDKDGMARGFGLPAIDPMVQAAQQTYEGLVALEKAAIKTIESQFKKTNPLAPFVTQTHGLGIKGIVRLLGVIGDPYIHPPTYAVERDPTTKKVLSRTTINEGGYRTLGQLFQYCGLTPQSRKRAGQKVTFSPEAHKRLYIIAIATVKHRESPYRSVYDYWKAAYQDRVGDNGKPWTKMHIEMATLRKVERRIVIDLYEQSRRIHEDADN